RSRTVLRAALASTLASAVVAVCACVSACTWAGAAGGCASRVLCVPVVVEAAPDAAGSLTCPNEVPTEARTRTPPNKAPVIDFIFNLLFARDRWLRCALWDPPNCSRKQKPNAKLACGGDTVLGSRLRDR